MWCCPASVFICKHYFDRLFGLQRQKKVKVLSYAALLQSRDSIYFWKVPILGPLLFLVTATCKDQQPSDHWSNDTVRGKPTSSDKKKNCPTATLSTTGIICTDMRSRPATDYPIIETSQYCKGKKSLFFAEVHTRNIHIRCQQNVEFLTVKPVGTYSNHWVVKR